MSKYFITAVIAAALATAQFVPASADDRCKKGYTYDETSGKCVKDERGSY